MPPSTAVPMLQQLLAHYIQSAGAAQARGDHGAAKEWCGHALRMAPDMPEAWFSLGLALRGLNHATEAVKAFVSGAGWTVRAAAASPITGGDGNREFFLHAAKHPGTHHDERLEQAHLQR